MFIVTKMRKSVAVVVVTCKTLDAHNVGGFKEELKVVVANHRRIVLDVSPLEFIDSSGLGAILSAFRQANSLSGNLKLACLARPVRVVVELTRMHRVFEIFETVDAAVQSYDA
jgi:anti-sigma B factor antagonist